MNTTEFKNRSNFPVTSLEDGKTYWISRSIAVVAIPFFEWNGELCVPLGLRSILMDLEPLKWGLPCGFLDWNESAKDAVRREMYEETGIDILDFNITIDQPDFVNSEPNPAENDTVSFRYLFCKDVYDLPLLDSNSDEICDLRWFSVNEIDDLAMAFNHKELIKWGLSKLPLSAKS